MHICLVCHSACFPVYDGAMQLRHAVYVYVMGIHHRYATVTYKWTYGVDMHAVYAQKDSASAYRRCIQTVFAYKWSLLMYAGLDLRLRLTTHVQL